MWAIVKLCVFAWVVAFVFSREIRSESIRLMGVGAERARTEAVGLTK